MITLCSVRPCSAERGISCGELSHHYHLGMVHYQQGRKLDAASEIRRALQMDPDFPEARAAREVLKTVGG